MAVRKRIYWWWRSAGRDTNGGGPQEEIPEVVVRRICKRHIDIFKRFLSCSRMGTCIFCYFVSGMKRCMALYFDTTTPDPMQHATVLRENNVQILLWPSISPDLNRYFFLESVLQSMDAYYLDKLSTVMCLENPYNVYLTSQPSKAFQWIYLMSTKRSVPMDIFDKSVKRSLQIDIFEACRGIYLISQLVKPAEGYI